MHSGTLLLLSPLYILIPSHLAFTALVPFQRDAPPQILRDVALPARLFNGAINGFYLIPSLLGNDVWQISRCEFLLGRHFRKIGS